MSIDGDTVFVFSTEENSTPVSTKAKRLPRGDYLKDIDVDIIGQTVADAVQQSIYDACKQADTIKFDNALKGVVPSYNAL